jgi:hypothetical protein
MLVTRLGLVAIVAWLALGTTADATATSWTNYRPDSASAVSSPSSTSTVLTVGSGR